MRTLLFVPLALSFALAAGATTPAHADTTYQFSGASCQPERKSDRDLALVDGGGISNLDAAAFSFPITVVCPVSGLESQTQTQVALRARLYDGNVNAIGGFWQLDNVNNGTIWWSSIKYACSAANGCTTPPGSFTGGADVRWTGGELFGSVTYFTTYSFRALIPGRCHDSSCGAQSWVRAYWTTHVQN
jgi:hypothetical protein